MNRIKGISIPDGAEKKYNKEYYRQIGIDMAKEMISFMKLALNEQYGYNFKL